MVSETKVTLILSLLAMAVAVEGTAAVVVVVSGAAAAEEEAAAADCVTFAADLAACLPSRKHVDGVGHAHPLRGV